jgi:tryptophanyl-tRNA synthetase
VRKPVPSQLRAKLKTAMTDPARVRRKDPGDPDKCNVASLHGLFSPQKVDHDIRAGCRSAAIGCIDCKTLLSDALTAHLGPIRERALALRADEQQLRHLLQGGAARARAVAQATMADVRRAVGL